MHNFWTNISCFLWDFCLMIKMGKHEKLQECDGIVCSRKWETWEKWQWGIKKYISELFWRNKDRYLILGSSFGSWVVRRVYHLALAVFSCYTLPSLPLAKKNFKRNMSWLYKLDTEKDRVPLKEGFTIWHCHPSCVTLPSLLQHLVGLCKNGLGTIFTLNLLFLNRNFYILIWCSKSNNLNIKT